MEDGGTGLPFHLPADTKPPPSRATPEKKDQKSNIKQKKFTLISSDVSRPPRLPSPLKTKKIWTAGIEGPLVLHRLLAETWAAQKRAADPRGRETGNGTFLSAVVTRM